MAAKKQETEISIIEVNRGQIELCLLGTTPLIYHAMSKKAGREFLLPAQKKNAAAKAASLKHNPLQEYRESFYTTRKRTMKTRLVLKPTMLKASMMSAALDLPGSTKAQIGRLTYVEGDEIELYGVPQMFMSIVKNSGYNAAPDVRTRGIVPEWCCRVSVTFVKPILKDVDIANLIAAAGMTQGLGDWRIQKGSGNYGAFTIVSPDDKDFKRIMMEGTKKAQDEAIKSPMLYDSETEEMYTWYQAETKKRGFVVVEPEEILQ